MFNHFIELVLICKIFGQTSLVNKSAKIMNMELTRTCLPIMYVPAYNVCEGEKQYI